MITENTQNKRTVSAQEREAASIKRDQRIRIDDAVERLSGSVKWIELAQDEVNKHCGIITRFRINSRVDRLQTMLRCLSDMAYDISEGSCLITTEMSEVILTCLDQAPGDMRALCDAVPLKSRSIENIYYAKRRFSEVC